MLSSSPKVWPNHCPHPTCSELHHSFWYLRGQREKFFFFQGKEDFQGGVNISKTLEKKVEGGWGAGGGPGGLALFNPALPQGSESPGRHSLTRGPAAAQGPGAGILESMYPLGSGVNQKTLPSSGAGGRGALGYPQLQIRGWANSPEDPLGSHMLQSQD